MSKLQDILAQTDRRALVDDVVTLIDEEVDSKGGFGGVALKTGYKAVKRLRGGRMIEEAADALLDDFTRALSPLYDDYLDAEGYDTFEAYLDDHPREATDALLSITDDKAEGAENQILRKTYGKLRGSAEGHVEDALPAVGRLIDKHAPAG
jgi:hypothetical protein